MRYLSQHFWPTPEMNPWKAVLLQRNHWQNRIRGTSGASRLDLQRILLEYTFSWGLYPIHYDPSTKRFIVSNSKLWIFTTIFILVPKFLVVFAKVRLIFLHGFHLKSISDMFPLYFMTTAILTALFHVHTIWRRKEIAELLNTWNWVLAKESSKVSPAWIYQLVLDFALFYAIFIPTLGLGGFVGICETHFLASVAPICIPDGGPNGPLYHASIPASFFLAVLNFLIIAELPLCVIPYISSILPILIEGLPLLAAIKSTLTTEGRARRTWVKSYRQFQLLMTEFNHVVGSVFLPMQMAGVITISVFGNYALIRLEEGRLFGLSSVLVFDSTTAAILVIWNQGARFQTLSSRIIQQSKGCNGDKLSRRVVRSCPIISVRVGGFYHLSRRVILDVISGVGLACLSLLLATGA